MPHKEESRAGGQKPVLVYKLKLKPGSCEPLKLDDFDSGGDAEVGPSVKGQVLDVNLCELHMASEVSFSECIRYTLRLRCCTWTWRALLHCWRRARASQTCAERCSRWPEKKRGRRCLRVATEACGEL